MPDASQPDPQATRRLSERLLPWLAPTGDQAAIVIWDGHCALSRLLAEAYRQALPDATSLDFERTANVALLTAFDLLEPGDVVVLVQSTRFAIELKDARRELRRRRIRLVEHRELARLEGPGGAACVQALASGSEAGERLLEALTACLADSALDGAALGGEASAGALTPEPND